MKKGTIFSICISPKMGMIKQEVPEALVTKHGIENDGNAGEWGRKWGRQVSCLNLNSVVSTNQENNLNAGPGTFEENILVDGIDLGEMTVGDQMKLGEDVVLEVTQIGKENHLSPMRRILGVSLLTDEGVFCKVDKGGIIKKGDPIEVLSKIIRAGGIFIGESS